MRPTSPPFPLHRARALAAPAHPSRVPCACSGALSNTAELSTGNIRSGAAFDNIKASWNQVRRPILPHCVRSPVSWGEGCRLRRRGGSAPRGGAVGGQCAACAHRTSAAPRARLLSRQALKFGDFSTNLKCNYDYNANRDFLKDCSLSGDLVEASGDDDVRVSYEVSHGFADKNTNVKLSANTQGTTLTAEYDNADGVKEVSAERDLDIGDQKVKLQPSWLVQAKTARVKLMSRLGNSDSVSAQIDYNTDDSSTSYEVGYGRKLEDGRDVSATFTPDKKEVEIDYVDNKFESGATWTATASVPLEQSGGSNLLDAAKLSLKRSWSW